MPHRVAAAMPVLRAQLEDERFQYFQGFADDPALFVAEVLAAHVRGEIDVPDDILRRLVSTMNLPIDVEPIEDDTDPDRDAGPGLHVRSST